MTQNEEGGARRQVTTMITVFDIIPLNCSRGAIGLQAFSSKQPNWEHGKSGSSESNRVEGDCGGSEARRREEERWRRGK